MGLAIGQQLGAYEILGAIGAGAMGEVYLARDLRLDRDVAIKVLPERFGADEGRLKRFQREAKSLASLNHLNIAQIYGIEHCDDVHFLVLEYVPGEMLAESLARGPMPMEEALRIAASVAAGLEAAHERGIVHRDVKPANIRLAPDGTAKILDFGIAQWSTAESMPSSTATTLTMEGGILGTPVYMAPEQVQGKPIDRRVDVWAFGCVLYECLSGRRAFDGETIGSIFGAIETGDVNFDRLVDVPPAIRRLIARCLRKDPRQRLRDVGDARIEIEDVLGGSSDPVAAPARRHSLPLAVAAGALALLVGSMVWLTRSSRPLAPKTAAHYSVPLLPLAEGLQIESPTGMAPPLAISRDGLTIAFAARGKDGVRSLYRRRVDESEPWRLEGSEGVEAPFFSPDGREIAFLQHGRSKLVRLPLDGGIPSEIHDVLIIRGASWGHDGRIVYAPVGSGLRRISDDGGPPEVLTELGSREEDHRWPQILPGEKAMHLLFTIKMRDGKFETCFLDLETQRRVTLGIQASYALYVPADPALPDKGFLLLAKGETLWARRFDCEEPAVERLGVRVLEDVQVDRNLGIPHLAVSDSGTLVYEPRRPASPGRQLVWVDREGNETVICEDKGFEFPRLSADESRVVFANHTGTGHHDIWAVHVKDRQNPSPIRITDGGNFIEPVWSPNGTEIIFSSFDTRNLHRQALGDSEALEIEPRPGFQFPLQWRADGGLLLSEHEPGRGWDIVRLSLKDRKYEPLIQTRATERAAAISPNGDWIAYVSDETGQSEVYLRWTNPLGLEEAVSTTGGTEPVWSKDGSELFFRKGKMLYAVSVPSSPEAPKGPPKELFEGDYVAGFADRPNYDVSSDGRFVMVGGGWELTAGRLDVRLNFAAELDQLLPPDG